MFGITLLADNKIRMLLALFLLFTGGIYAYPGFAGILLITALLVFGLFTIMWKETHVKMSGLVLLVLLALVNIGIHYLLFDGLKYGIDFKGGTRIPILLERSIDQKTMNEMIQIINKRIRTLGLAEAKVRAVGTGQIDVEVPSSDPNYVQFVQRTLSSQGVFRGVIEGKIALRGEDFFTTTITPAPASQLSTGVDWGVQFSLTSEGARRFAEAANGQANKPIYMFLDRPENAAVFMDWETARSNAPADSSGRSLLQALNASLAMEGAPVALYIIDELNASLLPVVQNVTAIVAANAPNGLRATLEERGYRIQEVERNALMPGYSISSRGGLVTDKWEGVGLLSMAILSPGVTQGTPVYSASITGSVGAASPQERTRLAQENVKHIESILKGGSLPVQISLGSSTVVPPSLGEEFLRLSLIGIVSALVVISLFIGLRYRQAKFILPIVVISISELVVLLSILGSFTIDLAAMAGIIAAIGVGVDAQIVITDELLKKSGELKERMAYAFAIIKTNVLVAIVGMLPLLFSGLVEVIGFAVSTILGALLGFLLSRPAYAILAEKIMGEGKLGEMPGQNE